MTYLNKRKTGFSNRKNNSTLRALLSFSLIVFLTLSVLTVSVSCQKSPTPEPDPTQTPTPEPVPEPDEIIETAKDIFFNSLCSENDYSFSLGIPGASELYNNLSEYAKDLGNVPSTTTFNTELSGSLNRNLIPGSSGEFLCNILEDAVFSINGKIDPVTAYAEFDLGLSLAEKKMLNVELISKKETLWLRSAELHPDYYSLEYRFFPTLSRTLDIDLGVMNNIPYFFQNLSSIQKTRREIISATMNIVKISEKAPHVLRPHIEYLRDNLGEARFSVQENAKISGVPGQDYTKVTLSVRSEEFNALLSGLLLRLKADPALMDLISESYGSAYSSLSSKTSSKTFPGLFEGLLLPDVNNVAAFFKDYLDAIRYSVTTDALGDTSSVEVSLFLEGKTVKCLEATIRNDDLGVNAAISLMDYPLSGGMQKTIFDAKVIINRFSKNPFHISIDSLSTNNANAIDSTCVILLELPDDITQTKGFSSIKLILENNGDNKNYSLDISDASIQLPDNSRLLLNFSLENRYSNIIKKANLTGNVTANILVEGSTAINPAFSLQFNGTAEIGRIIAPLYPEKEPSVDINMTTLKKNLDSLFYKYAEILIAYGSF